MKANSLCRFLAAVVAMAFGAIAGAQNIPQGAANRPSMTMRAPRVTAGLVKPLNVRAATAVSNIAIENHPLIISTRSFPPGSIQLHNTLPLWTFDFQGSRDGDHHQGVMVGRDPFGNPGTDRIPTYVIPLIFRTHTVATAYDPTTGNFSTAPGVTTIDPTQADDSCLAKPNDIPARLMQQSPLFNPAPFVFGGTYVGTTQYGDAFQRANFWTVLGNGTGDYHVLLQPLTTLAPVLIDVPASAGLAVGNVFEPIYGFSFCAPQLLVDLNWFDSYLEGTVIPALAAAGVGPDTFPIFLSYNTAWTGDDVANLYYCCAVGYHYSTGSPLNAQTYAVVDFDTTGFFVGPAAGTNTVTAAHEIAEWMNDPFDQNYVAPWGNIAAFLGGCSNVLEVGDALASNVVPVTMPNGYTYDLQELVFFSWFLGAPSIAVNGWYSNNGTFTTDAGPNCQISVN